MTCTNSARLVSSLECYMDDLVDSFEDFVKKSLVIISVAVGALILMLGYALKIVSERAQVPQAIGSPRTDTTIGCAHTCTGSQPQSEMRLSDNEYQKDSNQPERYKRGLSPGRNRGCKSSENMLAMPAMKQGIKNTSSAAANTGPMSCGPSFDEQVLRNIGLSSCSKSCMQSTIRSIQRKCSVPRILIPSMATCIPNHHLSTPRPCSKYLASRNSCCSMCCADDDRR